ncbi:MAG: hypothetical protein ACI814_002631, partial [Mariniblastus sp.]
RLILVYSGKRYPAKRPAVMIGSTSLDGSQVGFNN